MQAVLCTGAGAIRVASVPAPSLPGADWVKVRVEAAGLCGSDLHKLLRAWPPPGYLQTDILCHEIAGRVVECGEQVHNVVPGEWVAVEPLIPCRRCERCRSGQHQLCPGLRCLGRNMPGGFAEYVCAPASCLAPLPAGLSFEEGAMADLVAVAVHCLNLACPVGNGWHAAIIGDGPLGLITAQVARAFGAGRVDLVGKHDVPLRLAAAHGFADTVPGSPVGSGLKNCFDLVVEAVGGSQTDTLAQAIELAAPGGTVAVMGVYEFGYTGPMPLRQAFAKELRLVGCNSYGVAEGVREFETALALMAQGKVNTLPLITHRLPLRRFPDAIELARHRDTSGLIKVVLTP